MKLIYVAAVLLLAGCSVSSTAQEDVVMSGTDELWLRPSEQDDYTCANNLVLVCESANGASFLAPQRCRCR